jgi:hypothetical protein
MSYRLPIPTAPRYHAGMALTELRRYREAIDRYQVTGMLSPGWCSCRADGWLVERLAAHAIDRETFDAVRKVVDGGWAARGGRAVGKPGRRRDGGGDAGRERHGELTDPPARRSQGGGRAVESPASAAGDSTVDR